jgi:hypothetical protein
VVTHTFLRRGFYRVSLTCATLHWLVASNAYAQTDAAVSTAREIAKEGLNAYDAGHYDEANEKLSRALELVGVPTLALFTARANVKLGHLVRASELYLLATRLDPKGASESVQVQAQLDAEKERAELLPRIPRLTVALEGVVRDEVEVMLDGQAVPKALFGAAQLVDPGQHQVVAKRRNEEARGEVVLAEREHKTTKLAFSSTQTEGQATTKEAMVVTTTGDSTAGVIPEKATSSKGSTQRILGWVGVGLGSAGLLVGASTGVWLLSERSRMDDEGCSNNQCYTDQKSDVSSFNTLRTVSTVGLIAGTAFTAAGLTLLLSVPKEETTTALVIGPGFASVRGRF